MRKIIKTGLIFLIFINFIYVFSGAIHYPLMSVDVFAIWLLKAKEFYVNGVFPLSQLNAYPYSHPQYPILLPLIFSFIYKISGGVNETIVLLLYPFVYLAILYLAFKFFSRLGIKENLSLLFTYIYSMLSPLLAVGGRLHAGEADIFIVLIYWGIIHLSYEFFKTKNKDFAWLLVILAALASQVKQEGILASMLIFFLPARTKDKFIWFAVSIIPAVLWQIVVKRAGLVSDFGYTLPGFIELITRSGSIIYLVLKEMANYRNWYVFWPLFWLSIYLAKGKIGFMEKFINPGLLTFTVIIFLNYLFSSLDPGFYVPSSIDRILLQLSPLFITIFVINVTNILLIIFSARKI